MEEWHVLIDGEPISASIFDFGLYFFHNANELLQRGTGPYFYLPKMESYLEARLWNEIFITAQQQLAVPMGSIRATVQIDTILAAFEMNEILWELREHSAGLSYARLNYLSSVIRRFASDVGMVLPDREEVTMSTHFMHSYSNLCIKTSHRRGVSVMGGMSALIPIQNDRVANEQALASAHADKEYVARAGYDGTSVAHPGLVSVATEVFNRLIPMANQIDKQLPDFNPTAADLLQIPTGDITEFVVRQNVAVGLGYIEAWLRGIGSVPLFNLMEDAATAEVARAQLWQWVHHHARLDDGREVTVELVEETIRAELTGVKHVVGMERYRAYMRAAELLREVVQSESFTEFLTLTVYPRLIEREHYPMC
jgi:malate synthase